jgi:hypothetical protein
MSGCLPWSVPASVPAGTFFGSKAVNRSFSQLTSEPSKATLGPQQNEAEQGMVRAQVGGAPDDLQKVVRRELGADRLPLESGSSAGEGGRKLPPPAPGPSPRPENR